MCGVVGPVFSPTRLTQILDDSQARAIVTCTRHIELARMFQSQTRVVMNIDDVTALSDENPGLSVSANDLAALMYTSGSTGTPKGGYSSASELPPPVGRLYGHARVHGE